VLTQKLPEGEGEVSASFSLNVENVAVLNRQETEKLDLSP
jgi:hypothetical protein